jgi:hypothetical protein
LRVFLDVGAVGLLALVIYVPFLIVFRNGY